MSSSLPALEAADSCLDVRYPSDDVEAFALAARQWLQTVARPRAAATESGEGRWGQGSDSVAIFPEWEHGDTTEMIAAARSFLRARAAAGFGGITLSTSVGGRGLDHTFEARYEDVEGCFETPPNEIWNIGHHMVLPAIDRFGTDVQRRRLIEPGIQGDLFFCQLFSEPDAGSDLASVRTRAERCGDDWRVNGQKVWTSAAHISDFGMLLCRTDPDAHRHAGLTCFLVPMDAPGVIVRPLRQMTGGRAFNEVWLNDVAVPDWLRLGDVGQGWHIARSTLSTERISVPLGGPHAIPARLIALAQQLGCNDQPTIRQALAELVERRRIADFTMARVHQQIADGHEPAWFASVLKLQATQLLSAMGTVAGQILGARMQADSGDWGTYVWARHLMESAGLRIGGGTDEIQRNLIGEIGLGLPREQRTEAGR